MIRIPDVFLMDEPMARLDAAMRRSLRAEFRLIQQGYRVTTIYATNDQEDAMALADRIVVLDQGTVRQVGEPADVYRSPVDRFVAEFIGSPPMGFLTGVVREPIIEVGGFRLGLPAGVVPNGVPVAVGVRPEDWEFSRTDGISATIDAVENLGAYQVLQVAVGGERVPVRAEVGVGAVGASVVVKPIRYHVFDGSGRAVYRFAR